MRSGVRRFVVGLACCLLAALAVTRAQQTPVFRSGVALVTIDVTVLDHDGRPVTGLTATDFTVTLDKHPAPVRTLDYEEAPAATVSAQPAAPARSEREVSNRDPAHEPRVIVIMADDLSMSASRGKRMFFSASRFVASLPPEDLVGFTTSSGVTTINPTWNHAAIEAALRHTVGEFVDPRALPPADVTVGLDEALQIAGGDSEATLEDVAMRECFQGMQQQQITMQIMQTTACVDDVRKKADEIAGLTRNTAARQRQAYLGVIDALAPAPGLKHVVLISDGLALDPRASASEGLTPIARAAAASGVELSVLYEQSDLSLEDSSATQAQVRRGDDQGLLVTGVQNLASMTGGEFYRVIGAPDPFFTRVEAAASGVYRLGVEPDGAAAPGKDFSLEVSINRPNVVVHANRHAVAPAPAATSTVDERLRDTVARGIALYGVPVTLATALRRGPSAGQIDLGANVEVPASVPGPLTLRFGLVDPQGTMKTAAKTVAKPADGGDYRVTLSLPVAAGDYQLRFAVADANGEVGSVQKTISAQLRQVGPFLASDLLTSWNGADGRQVFLALETLPRQASSLNAFLELYPASGSDAGDVSKIDVQFSLTPIVDEPTGPAKPASVTHDVTPVLRAGTVYAASRFAADQLQPGEYALVATVLVGGQTAGQVQATVVR